MLWKILRHYGIPAKIVTMIQVLYDCFQAWVLHEGRMTEPLEMKTKVRQRCILSPILFLVSLDWVTMQAYGENKTRIQFAAVCKKLKDLEFADDLVFVSQRIAYAWQKIESLQVVSKVGLKVNVSKTKELKIGSNSPGNTGYITC